MKVMQDMYRGVHEGDAGHVQGVHEGDAGHVQRSAWR